MVCGGAPDSSSCRPYANDLGLQAGDRIMLREGSAPSAGGVLTPLFVSTLLATLTTVLNIIY